MNRSIPCSAQCNPFCVFEVEWPLHISTALRATAMSWNGKISVAKIRNCLKWMSFSMLWSSKGQQLYSQIWLSWFSYQHGSFFRSILAAGGTLIWPDVAWISGTRRWTSRNTQLPSVQLFACHVKSASMNDEQGLAVHLGAEAIEELVLQGLTNSK